ncbi:MAG: Rhodanese-related sulfurtransferase [Verrucomicrobia bacterium]|jgi:rhodanese-related sulfurtransferase|nr:MAG: Rhodanese-related sulfurtransferase [Verrucomicrobiota bacterium]
MNLPRFLGACSRDVLVLLGLTLVAAAVTKAAHPGAPPWFVQPDADPYSVSRAEVRERWNDEVLWIDARSAASFEAGHQVGALRLPPDEWNELLADLFDQIASSDRPIVVYCDGEKCGKSKDVATRLREVGVGDVFHLRGGWTALQAK